MTTKNNPESSTSLQFPPQKFRIIVVGLLLVALGSVALFTQAAIKYDDVQADQIFRQGVARFNDGYHSEAVVMFQKVLSLQPQNYLARTWLGRAFFYAGFESAAIKEWTTVQSAGAGSPALTAFLESLQARRGLSQDVREDFDFFPVHELSTNDSKPNQFRRPSSVVTLSNGTSYIASFGTNSIIQMDVNGHTVRTLRGGFTHFSGPFDLTLVQGSRLFATQMLSDQVFELDLNGNVVKVFGSHGDKPGQFMGPQYIAWDGQNSLFVSDFGNRQISKFDLDGNFIMSFGYRNGDFSGLERPTGLLFQDGVLYVGDASRKNPAIYRFDTDGNLLGSIPDPRLADLESIKPFEDDQMLLTTRSAILSLEPENQIISEVHVEDKNPHTRYTSAWLDPNGNILAADFDTEQVAWFSRIAGIYSGLHVQINRVAAAKFPEVYLECSILDNLGNPVVGLDKDNFTVTEGGKPLNDVKLVGMGYQETAFSGAILVQADQTMATDFSKEALGNAVGGIFDSLGPDSRLSLVSSAQTATVEAPMGSSRQVLQASIQNIPATPFWYLDLGIRTAVPQILAADGLRHVFFVGNGTLPEDAFARYGLEENLNYLRNNRIRFSVIQTTDGPLDPGLDYLVKQTGGIVMPLYNPRGLIDLASSLVNKKDGSYLFRYTSLFDSDFGRKYLPVEVEAKLFQKSGRDESGYFAPLRF